MDNPEDIDHLAEETGVKSEYERLTDSWGERLFELDTVDHIDQGTESASVSVTGLVTYAQCPKRFYWTDVDPLPRRRNESATRGTEIHRRIELHQRGQVPFEDFEADLYDAVEGAGTGAGDVGGFETYESSRFANERARFVEVPFAIETANGYAVRGRIDAIYEDGSHWEVVDFKSGRRRDDPSRMVQLEAYAVAVEDVDFGTAKPDTLDVTFAYLGGGVEEVTTRADTAWVDTARSHIDDLTSSIEVGEFTPTPGEWCHHCDFLQFCEPGKKEVAP